MSDWLDKFKQKGSTPQESNDLEEEIRPDNALDEYDEDVQESGDSSMELETFDMDLDEIVADISKTNSYIFASLKAMNEELKAGFTLVRSEMNQRVTNMEQRVDALEEKVTRSLLAMEDGNEKRTLLLANALEEINDLVADPDGMTDVFKVAPDIAMGAIERKAQGELSDVKPFDPNDEIYLPETPLDTAEEDDAKEIAHMPDEQFDEMEEKVHELAHTDPVSKEIGELTMEEEWASQNKIAEMVDEEYPDLLTGEEEEILQQKYPHLTLQQAIAAEDEMETLANKDYDPYSEGGAGEIQSFILPEELAGQGYTEESYNKVMDYINGDIKWKDIMKYAGGMKQAKALVDPVKASLDML